MLIFNYRTLHGSYPNKSDAVRRMILYQVRQRFSDLLIDPVDSSLKRSIFCGDLSLSLAYFLWRSIFGRDHPRPASAICLLQCRASAPCNATSHLHAGVFLLRAAATRLDMQVRAPDDRSLDGRHESRGQGLMLRGSAAKALAEAATRPGSVRGPERDEASGSGGAAKL